MGRVGLFVAAIVVGCFVTKMTHAADIAVVGGKPDDAFWNKIKKGVDDARLIVEANGGSVNYLQLQTYDNLGPDAASLIHTAIGQNIDGLVVADWVPEAQDEAIKAAIAAGITVMLYNAGSLAKAQELGAINYIGSDDYSGGVASGDYYGQNGNKNIICVNTLPGNANLEAFCNGVLDGIKKQGGSGNQLSLPANSFGDPIAVSETIKVTLLQDATIDGVITIGNVNAEAAASAIAQAGKGTDVKLGSLDFDRNALERIRQGTQTFAIDQQPYLQSFLSVIFLASHLDFGTDLPVRPLSTGPDIIDSSNIEAVLVGEAKGAR